MESSTVAITLLVSIFFFLLIIRTPIVFAIGIPTVITVLYLGIPLMTIVQNIVKGLNSFTLMAVPFFILAGEVMGAGGISDRLVTLANAAVGWMPGGLAMVNCVDSMFFGGISGSSAADCASLGPIVIPMMTKQGYDKEFSTSITMASSVQGILIPPSHNMVTYSMVAGSVSIGRLLWAGLTPGVILGLSLAVYCYFVSIKRKYPRNDSFSWKALWKALRGAAWGMITIVIIMGGVTTGVFTATESAAVAVVWAIFVTFCIYREAPISELWRCLGRAIKTLAMVMILIGTSAAFGWVLSYLQVPKLIAEAIFSVTNSKFIIMLMLNIMMLFLGMLMDMSAIILISTPVLLPIATAIGVDPVHFGVIMILNLGIGLLTPPVGSTLFIGSAISGIKIETLSKAMIPFYIVMVLVLILIVCVPEISMWLPNLLMPLK